jgi:hypothetical protein
LAFAECLLPMLGLVFDYHDYSLGYVFSSIWCHLN